ncbi:MAG: hypothetical protein ACTJHT_13310 [Sphingobacterium sp.]
MSDCCSLKELSLLGLGGGIEGREDKDDDVKLWNMAAGIKYHYPLMS